MLKGIKASQPKKELRKIWDIQQLRDWVCHNPPLASSFFQVTRHVALLLLLASGRRIHDLTLLHVDDDHLQRFQQDVILWPAFGSKTDNPSRCQSGWHLSSNDTDKLWDPVHWLNILLDLRKARCGSLTLTDLFISSRGPVKKASRATIAAWVNTALKGANIIAPPGSVRSAVSSDLARANTHIDEILARANWRSAATFLKHYYRPIEAPGPSQSSNPVGSLFKPSV
ncbi:hypothetical protein M8J76_012974 [Diaphorina citri]|nr:hypothetical protein M8J77_022658 [Diaphorina citri]KAI5741379.1 hypothetical protein M8J76_012974 [Diaphorina citri]KAI5755028.1 hypothetical protein M8J77_013482 [Diaphorina citri]